MKARIRPPERKTVTVCIGAICNAGDKERGPMIISCSDALMSGALGKSEGRLKNRPVGNGWGVMSAGEDGEMDALVEHIRTKLRVQPWNGVTSDQAMDAVRAAYAARKREKIEELVAAKFGITYEDLRKTGATQFPPEIFRETMWAIEACKLEAECLIYGFSEIGAPILITAAGGHIYRRQEFGVIGAGGYLAQSMLLHRAYDTYTPLEEALYLVFEAKKHAEGETSVGEKTFVVVAQRDGKRFGLTPSGHIWAQSAYEAFKPRPVELADRDFPSDALGLMFDVSKEL